MNGLKHLTLESAHGLIIDLYGPLSLRRNDMRLLGNSRILARFSALQANRPAYRGRLGIKGDSAYPWLLDLSSYHKVSREGPALTERQKNENRVLKVIRESIEWNYGSTAAMFKYLVNLEKLKIMKGTKTRKVYIVASILRNCHTILYGCQTSNFYNLSKESFPTLQQYLRQE